MKLFSFSLKNDSQKKLGAIIEDQLIDLTQLSADLPTNIDQTLINWSESNQVVESTVEKLWLEGNYSKFVVKESDIVFHPPTTDRCSFRDFYAFDQHVKTARAQRGLKVVDEWYEIPVFYYSVAGRCLLS